MIESGEELLWSLILLIISVVWLSISTALLGVLGCQAVGPGASGVVSDIRPDHGHGENCGKG
jgi:hypothetical protein